MFEKDLANKKIVLIGFGKENQAVFKFLKNKYNNIFIAVADKNSHINLKDEDKKNINILHLGDDYLDFICDYEIAVLSPGINIRQKKIQQAIENGLKVTAGINIFWAHKEGKVIAVTGTKGKSTTVSLINKVLNCAKINNCLVGNIGNPAIEYVDEIKENGYYIFEMSSYMLEHFKYKPDYSIFLNIYNDHLDYHHTFLNYFLAKKNICSHPDNNDYLIYNKKNNILNDYYSALGISKYAYNDGVRSYIKDNIIYYNESPFLELKDIKLKGEHNLENILAVISLCDILKIDFEIIKKSIKEFLPLEHRLELVGQFKNILFYNDSISTTPESTIAAIKSFNDNVDTIIVGGSDRFYDFESLSKTILNSKINNIIYIPETGEIIKDAIIKEYNKNTYNRDLPNFIYADNMQKIVNHAYKITQKNKICLLSTASPSYSIFKNYIDKGEQFKKYIKELGN